MEEDALAVGVPYDLFWGDMTPTLFRKYTKAYNKRLEDIYIAIGVNNGAKYPKHPFTHKESEGGSVEDYQKLAKQKYGKKE